MGFIRDLFGGAARDAARLQADASDRAIASQERSRDVARSDLAPFKDAGAGILDFLGDFVREGPETELTRSAGFNDIQRSSAARGKLNSGDTLEGLTSFNNRLNEGNRQNRFSELFNLATLGANAASGQANASLISGRGIADTIVGKGDALAAGRIGSSNQIGKTLKGITSFLTAGLNKPKQLIGAT